MRFALFSLFVLLPSCVAETTVGEDVSEVGERSVSLELPPIRLPVHTPPVVRRETRAAWDDLIGEKLPKWEVYELPRGSKRDVPILAVPKDGRGVPLVLWFGHYHYHGEAYFAQMLKSGFLSVLDLQVILHELRKWPKGHPPKLASAPKHVTEPLTQALVIPKKRLQQVEGEGPVSYPGDIDDHAGQGGPPTVVTTPTPTVTGKPVYHCGGAIVSGPNDCPDYDESVSGGEKLERAIGDWYAHHGEAAAEAVEATPLVPSMAALCEDPRARSAGAGGAPCALVPPARDMLPGDTVGSFVKRHFFHDGKGEECKDDCNYFGVGAVAASTTALMYLCIAATRGVALSPCINGSSQIVAWAGSGATSSAVAYALVKWCSTNVCAE